MPVRTPRNNEVQALRAALEAERRRAEQFSDNLRQIAWTSDASGRTEALNQFWYEYTGLSKEADREEWAAPLHPEDRPKLQESFAACVRDRSPWTAEYRLRDRQGAYRWFLGRCAPVLENGQVLRWVGTAIEIDEQVRLRRELRAREAETRLLLDTVRAMILYKDRHDRVVQCNRAAADWFGRSPEELVGISLQELFPAEAEQLRRSEREVARTGRPVLGVIEELTNPVTGKKHWLRTDKVPRCGKDGSVLGVIVFRVDITEIKRAEEVTRESEERQRAFVANVSHELRTPVAAIKGFAETLRRGALREPKNRMRFVRIIESHADRLAWIVEDLLTLSDLDAGRAMDLRPLSLAREAQEYLSSIASLTGARRLKVACRVPKTLWARADRPHLLQVLENLVGNAVKYTPAGGKVRVEGAAAGEWARLTVRDSGVGIAPEHLERVFDRFYRVEKSRQDGSGLGLHIVRKIAAAHGGRVWAESWPGKGSAFHLELPRASVTPS